MSQTLAMIPVWLGFVTLVLWGIYEVVAHPNNAVLANYLPLAIMCSVPLAYLLCGYVGGKARAKPNRRQSQTIREVGDASVLTGEASALRNVIRRLLHD